MKPGPKPKDFSERRKLIRQLKDKGFSYAVIGKLIGLTRQ
jgi:SOS response regulatory protein OraA/RecX